MPVIFILDDDAHLRHGLSLRLQSAGFEVLAATHPEAALSVVLHNRPDLILLDIDMPRFSGLDFHECLRATDRGRNIPIIYLSGAGSPPNRQDAFRQGARAFVAKPYNPDELLATIRGVLEAPAPGGIGMSTKSARALM